MSLQRTTRILVALLGLASASPSPLGCTTFVLQKDGQLLFGRNFDWYVGEGLVIANPRRVSKQALPLPMSPRETHPARWISQYGSITFNSLGRDFPTGGMNEAGLVVEVMWLNETQYPSPDERPELHVLQWTQYLLDTCRTTDEVLNTDAQVRISADSIVPQHFLVCDAEGNTAAIEFLEGRRVVHRSNSLPYACLTNDTYDKSTTSTREQQTLGDSASPPTGRGSIERFVRTANHLASRSPSNNTPVDHAFTMLDDVNQGYDLNSHATVWSIVYDIAARQIHFRTHNHREIRTLNLKKLDFDCHQPVPVWNVLADNSGDLSGRSQPLTQELNLETARKSINHPSIVAIFGDMSRLLAPVANYPTAFTHCAD